MRYFEDRGILSPDHFSELSAFSDYSSVLDAGVGATYTLFESLAERFNGDVFAFDENERSSLTNLDVATVAAFLRGTDVQTGQSSFWPYDFSVIPPELVSSIYEQLLEETQSADAAYYTPRFVVDLILDEVLSWNTTEHVRILDPSCGSGIFLAEAFRRLVFAATSQGQRRMGFRALSDLLTSSIFGVDRSQAAIGVAAFGLYLALLEELDPPSAWTDAKLPRLAGQNLLNADFFSGHPLSEEHFDVIVGNPPWQSELSTPAAHYVAAMGLPIADRQAAQAFAWKATDALAPGGSIGLLMPAKALLHNKSNKTLGFRKALLERLNVRSIIDLSNLRRDTFTAAVAPAAVLVADHGEMEPVRRTITHVAPRASPLQTAIDGLVVSEDDVHEIPRGLAATHPDLWKIFLWGNADDFDLITRLRSLYPPLKRFATERNWIYGQGFQIRGGDSNSAETLVGLPFIPTESIRPFRIEPGPIGRVVDGTMHRPRDPKLYEGPHLLVRRGLANGRLAAALVRNAAAFNSGVFGVAAPRSDIAALQLLQACINSSLGNYFHFLTSSSWGVERDFVEENEHLSLPFPVDVSGKSTRRVLDLADAIERSEAPGSAMLERLHTAIFALYELNEDEADLVRDRVNMGIDQFEKRSRSAAYSPPNDVALQQYRHVLMSSLNVSLSSATASVSTPAAAAGFTAIAVHLDDGVSNDTLEAGAAGVELEELLREVEAEPDWVSASTVIQPSALVFRGDTVFVVKPTEARHWTRSKARSDAGELLGYIALRRKGR